MRRGLRTLREHTSKPWCLMETDNPDFTQPCLISAQRPEEHTSLLPSPFPSFSISSLSSTKILQQTDSWVVSSVLWNAGLIPLSPRKAQTSRDTHALWALPPLTSLPALTVAGPHLSSQGPQSPEYSFSLRTAPEMGQGGRCISFDTGPPLPALHLVPGDAKLTVTSAGECCQDPRRPLGAGPLLGSCHFSRLL